MGDWVERAAAQDSTLFEGVPREERAQLLRSVGARVRRLGEGEVLRHTGDKVPDYQVVLEGRVQSSMLQGGESRVIAEFGAGESFAEAVSASAGAPCPVDIRALEPTVVLLVPARELERCALPCAERVRANLMAQMSRKVGVLSRTLAVIGEPRLSDRVVAYLERLPRNADGTVTVPLTRQEWASALRVVDKSLIRELRSLQDEGLIEVHGRRIRMLQR